MIEASQTDVDAATAYEQLFVRSLFQPWADLVLAQTAVSSGAKVLDVACGTGVLARRVLASDPGTAVTGIDPNAGMLAVAEKLEPRIQWTQGTAEALPFDDSSFHLVLSQFGLMFFHDREQALREMARVLIPGGDLMIAVWDDVARIPPYATAIKLLHRLAGPEAAAALRAPFVLGDREELAALFTRAGVPEPVVATFEVRAAFPNIRSMLEADLRGWLPLMGVNLEESLITQILSEAEEELRQWVTESGTFEFPTSAHLVAASKR